MSLVTAQRSITQLVISFIIGAAISVASSYFFGINDNLTMLGFSIPIPLLGVGISVGISIILGIWAGRIRSNRLVGSIGHVIFYSVFTFQLQELIL